MASSRRTINISARGMNRMSSQRPRVKKKSGFKRFLFLLIFLTSAFFLLTNENVLRSLKVGLNEVEIRYDTFSVSFSEVLDEDIVEAMKEDLEKVQHGNKKRFEFVDADGDIEIGVFGEGDSLFTNYLIPVGHFYWIENDLSKDEIEEKAIVVEVGKGELVKQILEHYLDTEIAVEEKDDVLQYLENNEDTSLSFVNLDDLDYEYKVLYFENRYFLEDLEGAIPYEICVKTNSAPKMLGNVIKVNTEEIFEEFVLEDILKINMSGVTAISRNLAVKIENSGDNAYPARRIADFLSNADIVHTSNEVSFVPDCKPSQSMSFCSHPKYLETLEAIGVNIVELTGNHNNDFGAKYNAETIEMYKEKGWDYYGGGLNTVDAEKILYKEAKDSKIAFIGYNHYDTLHNNVMNLAGETRAGANSFSLEKMERDIKEAKAEDSVVVVTFQFQECWSYPPSDVIYPVCYKPLANPDQKKIFRAAVDYGADIVIGSQAHQPQTYEVYNNKLIFYGTGNLFFDQILWIGTRQGMVLSHYVYKNKVLQSKVTTTLYDNDMQPYVTEGEDRELLLELLRTARN